ncbi:DMT family transporter [Actinokineospora sp.]|uniref:DMT family transporter n=1 Tax=Actinokineospora sp. TaxID=1872133 RepID=UPI003D6B54DA
MRDPSRSFGPYTLLTITMVFWGSAFATSQIAVGEVPHSVAALGRFGIGAVFLVAVMLLRRGPRKRLPRRAQLRAAFAGAIGVFAYNALFFWGLTFAPSVDGALIVPVLSPILTTLFLVVTRQETASKARLAGFGLAAVGAALFLVAVSSETPAGSLRLVGDGIFLLGAATWATYTLVSKKVIAGIEPLAATTYGTVAGSLLLGAMAIPSFGEVRWDELSNGFWINMAYLGILPTAVAYLYYYRGVRDVGPASAATMMFLVPVFGSLCAFILLDQRITAIQAVGGALMLLGALLAVTNGRIALGRTATTPGRAGR